MDPVPLVTATGMVIILAIGDLFCLMFTDFSREVENSKWRHIPGYFVWHWWHR